MGGFRALMLCMAWDLFILPQSFLHYNRADLDLHTLLLLHTFTPFNLQLVDSREKQCNLQETDSETMLNSGGLTSYILRV